MRGYNVFITIFAALVMLAAATGMSFCDQGADVKYSLPLNEAMTYKVKALGLSIAEQKNLTRGIVDLDGKKAVNIFSEIKTSPWIKMYEIDNTMETFIDPVTLSPLKYQEKANEKDWRAIENTYFEPGLMKYDSVRGKELDKKKSGEHAFTEWPQDELSMVYYVRQLPLEEGKSFNINACVDMALEPAVIKVEKKTRLKTIHGKKEVFYITSTLGESKFYLGVDPPHIPYRFEVKLNFGGIKAFLTEYGGE